MTDAMPWDNALPGPPRNFVSDGIQYHTTAPERKGVQIIQDALNEKAKKAIREKAKEVLREMADEESEAKEGESLWIEVYGKRYYSDKMYDGMLARAEAAEKILQARSADIYAEGYRDCSVDMNNAYSSPTAGIEKRQNPYDESCTYHLDPMGDGFGVRAYRNGVEESRPTGSPSSPADLRHAVDDYNRKLSEPFQGGVTHTQPSEELKLGEMISGYRLREIERDENYPF